MSLDFERFSKRVKRSKVIKDYAFEGLSTKPRFARKFDNEVNYQRSLLGLPALGCTHKKDFKIERVEPQTKKSRIKEFFMIDGSFVTREQFEQAPA